MQYRRACQTITVQILFFFFHKLRITLTFSYLGFHVKINYVSLSSCKSQTALAAPTADAYLAAHSNSVRNPTPRKKKKRVVIYKSKQKETPQPGRSTAGPPVSLKPAASESPFGVGWPHKVVRSRVNVPARTDAGDAQAPIRWA